MPLSLIARPSSGSVLYTRGLLGFYIFREGSDLQTFSSIQVVISESNGSLHAFNQRTVNCGFVASFVPGSSGAITELWTQLAL